MWPHQLLNAAPLFFGSCSLNSKNPDNLLLGMGQCTPLCFDSFPAVREALRRRNARLLSQEWFFFFLSGKCRLTQYPPCSPDSLGDDCWWAVECLQRSKCIQTLLDRASSECAVCGDCCCSTTRNAERVLWGRAQPSLRSILANPKGKGDYSGATASHAGTVVF